MKNHHVAVMYNKRLFTKTVKCNKEIFMHQFWVQIFIIFCLNMKSLKTQMLTAIHVSMKIHILNSVSRSLEGEMKDFISWFAAKLCAVELYVKWPIFMSVNETLTKNTGYHSSDVNSPNPQALPSINTHPCLIWRLRLGSYLHLW